MRALLQNTNVRLTKVGSIAIITHHPVAREESGLPVPSRPLTYRCLVISPSDVDEARDAVCEVLLRWNASVGVALDVRVEPVRWELHARPELGGHPQTLLDRQLVDGADFGIAVFGARLGTPTTEWESGSVQEIERLRTGGAPVMVYFDAGPLPRGVDLAQLESLRAFQARMRAEGIVFEFRSLSELREHITPHVTAMLSERAIRERFSTVIETRTSDPESPREGQMWLRTDL